MIEDYNKELDIILNGVCDGLRQEVRSRYLTQLVAPWQISTVAEEREAQLRAMISFHLKMLGFTVHTEGYFYSQPSERRPDLCIYLPVSRRYLFLEVKPFHPYTGISVVIRDIVKLESINDPDDKYNGLIALGFRNPIETYDRFPQKYQDLSQEITDNHRYREIGIRTVPLDGMDRNGSYAMVGLCSFRYLIIFSIIYTLSKRY